MSFDFKKCLKILSISLISILILFFVLELSFYYVNGKKYKEQTQSERMPKFHSVFTRNLDLKDYDLKRMEYTDLNESECENLCFRKPVGKKYKGEPIVLFGCSFGYGEYLNPEQTFARKLSDAVKRPVYNRSLIGHSADFMYYQVKNYEFYNQVPPSDTVIYVMVSEQFRRLLTNKFDPMHNFVHPHYKFDAKNKELIPETYDAWFNIVNGSYVYSTLKIAHAIPFAKKEENLAKIDDYVVTFFVKTKEELEKRWDKKVKFAVLFYNVKPISRTLREKLEENGIITIATKDFTDEDLFAGVYQMPDNGHPTEYAWDYLTPKIVAEAKKRGVL